MQFESPGSIERPVYGLGALWIGDSTFCTSLELVLLVLYTEWTIKRKLGRNKYKLRTYAFASSLLEVSELAKWPMHSPIYVEIIPYLTLS
jgi:hypothetical protein